MAQGKDNRVQVHELKPVCYIDFRRLADSGSLPGMLIMHAGATPRKGPLRVEMMRNDARWTSISYVGVAIWYCVWYYNGLQPIAVRGKNRNARRYPYPNASQRRVENQPAGAALQARARPRFVWRLYPRGSVRGSQMTAECMRRQVFAWRSLFRLAA